MSAQHPSKARQKVAERPAESATAGLAATVVAVLAIFDIEVSTEDVALIVAAVGVVPAIVTAIVNKFQG